MPKNDSAFDQFFKNIIEYASLKCAGATPEWTHISLASLDVINIAYDAWYHVYALTINPHTPEQATVTHNVRKVAEKALRDFVDLFLCVEPVSNSDRACMGIPAGYTVSKARLKALEAAQKKAVQIKRGFAEPREKVGFEVKPIKGTDTPKTPPRTPRGYVARVAWDVLDKPPKSINELRRHALAKYSPYVLKFSKEDKGKTAYFSMAWQNARGMLGPWSEIQSMVVP